MALKTTYKSGDMLYWNEVNAAFAAINALVADVTDMKTRLVAIEDRLLHLPWGDGRSPR